MQCLYNTGIGRALEFQKDIDDFVARNRDLRAFELSEDEWAVIVQVCDWLGAFRAATTQMSTSKESMLSSTIAIFRGLQEHIRKIYSALPESVPQRIKDSLIEAHRKLSDYYHRYDQSPFYTWAARKFNHFDFMFEGYLVTHQPIFLVLDPRISYEGVCGDYMDDPDLLSYLDSSKTTLHAHYIQHYSGRASSLSRSTNPTQSTSDESPSQVNFTSRYKKKDATLRDELDEYFKLPREDFDSCEPLKWWVERHAQFPNLYCLARDVLSIPGMFTI